MWRPSCTVSRPAGRRAGRLEAVEERLAALARLGRKHGGGIAEVLAHAAACRERRETLKDADVSFEALRLISSGGGGACPCGS